jgi:transcriptional regulator with XRE-family HTH domain
MTEVSGSFLAVADKDAPHAVLGAIVRERREGLQLSMDELAQRARVGRSSVHRLEHGIRVTPTPSKLARILAVVGISDRELGELLPESEWRDEVSMWLARADRGDSDMAAYVEARRPASSAATQPDLVGLHADGTIVTIEVKASPEARSERLDDMTTALRAAGYLVTRPVG